MTDLSSLSGPLGIKLVNDYFFHVLLQKNNNVLRALVASLLHMNLDDILSIHIENEIVFGESLNDKDFILDIRVLMNDHTILNLEMQVVDQSNWVERSMSYLCRTFDNLEHGKDYIDVKPAVQIGLLNYTLFPDAPEFYASYYLMNEKTYQKYSDKLRLSVLDLTRIDLATDEDRLYGIDHWAKLFKATTWEELKMLAQNNKVMSDAVSTVYEITQDPRLVDKIRAREEWTALENRKKRETEEIKRELAEKDRQLAESEATIADLQATVASLLTQLQDK